MMTIAGSAVDSIEIARPWITLVPWPVTEDCGDRLHRAIVGAGVVFGDPDDQAGDDEADDAAVEQRQCRCSFDAGQRAEADQVVDHDGDADERQHAGGDQALVQRAHDRLAGAELDEEGADDRGDDADAADGERQGHHVQQQRRRSAKKIAASTMVATAVTA